MCYTSALEIPYSGKQIFLPHPLPKHHFPKKREQGESKQDEFAGWKVLSEVK